MTDQSKKSPLWTVLRIVAMVAILGYLAWWILFKPPASSTTATTGPSGTPTLVRSAANISGQNEVAASTAFTSSIPGPNMAGTAAYPLPPLNAPLVQSYEALRAGAAAGSVQAACRLAFELHRCSRVHIFRSGASNLEAQLGALSPSDPRTERQRTLLNRAKQMAADADAACEGFKPGSPDEAWQLAYSAAMSGHRASLARFVIEKTGLETMNPAGTAEGWVAYKNAAPLLLQRGIDLGMPNMLSFAASAHLMRPNQQSIVPYDPVKSLAYNYALLSVANDAYRSQVIANIEYTIRDAKVSDTEVAKAKSDSESLITTMRKSGVQAVDLSRGLIPNNDGSHCAETP